MLKYSNVAEIVPHLSEVHRAVCGAWDLGLRSTHFSPELPWKCGRQLGRHGQSKVQKVTRAENPRCLAMDN